MARGWELDQVTSAFKSTRRVNAPAWASIDSRTSSDQARCQTYASCERGLISPPARREAHPLKLANTIRKSLIFATKSDAPDFSRICKSRRTHSCKVWKNAQWGSENRVVSLNPELLGLPLLFHSSQSRACDGKFGSNRPHFGRIDHSLDHRADFQCPHARKIDRALPKKARRTGDNRMKDLMFALTG